LEEGSYQSTDLLKPFNTYWIYVKEDCTAKIFGSPLSEVYERTLYPGWNMVYVPDKSWNDIRGTCEQSPKLFSYDAKNNSFIPFAITEKPKLGQGYFVYVKDICKISISTARQITCYTQPGPIEYSQVILGIVGSGQEKKEQYATIKEMTVFYSGPTEDIESIQAKGGCGVISETIAKNQRVVMHLASSARFKGNCQNGLCRLTTDFKTTSIAGCGGITTGGVGTGKKVIEGGAYLAIKMKQGQHFNVFCPFQRSIPL